MKLLLTEEELIQHMKSKGIRFELISEEDAKDFLCRHNYYMKLASYRANYQKIEKGKKEGQYRNLDFAYLQELSTIDMYLRYIVVEMCLDIEHAIKVRLLNEIANNPVEDGYNIVRKFLAKENNIGILKRIKSHKSGEYCKDLIEKYYPYFPAWVFVEVVSFGDLLYFCEFYEEMYNIQIANNQLMNIVRDIRNASAHSNCLINRMTERLDSTKQPNSEITTFVGGMSNISGNSRSKNLNYKFAYSFVTLLYIYNQLMTEPARTKRYEQLREFMEGRMLRHKDYFKSNSKITGVYHFIKKVVDNLLL